MEASSEHDESKEGFELNAQENQEFGQAEDEGCVESDMETNSLSSSEYSDSLRSSSESDSSDSDRNRRHRQHKKRQAAKRRKNFFQEEGKVIL